MNIGLSFILGITAASLGTTLPGLLNMTVVKVNARDGRNRALWFSFGASLVVFFQTLIAVFFARFIDRRADISHMLQEIGLVLFALLSAYFFWAARKPKKKKKDEIKLRSKSSRFFLGMLLSILNLFPVPYYVFISITLASYGYFSFDTYFIYTFSFGTALAAFLIFYVYILFFDKIEDKTRFITQNINWVIGTLTALVACITLCKVLMRQL